MDRSDANAKAIDTGSRAAGSASAGRRAAWVTRRAKHGPSGHAGVYARSRRERLALALIVELQREGVLSEGQCCKALDMGRVSYRVLADALSSAL